MRHERRSRLETVYSILEVLSGGNLTTTRLMYKSNLSWRVLSQYVKILSDASYLSDNGYSGISLTPSGRELYQEMLGVKEKINALNLSSITRRPPEVLSNAL